MRLDFPSIISNTYYWPLQVADLICTLFWKSICTVTPFVSRNCYDCLPTVVRIVIPVGVTAAVTVLAIRCFSTKATRPPCPNPEKISSAATVIETGIARIKERWKEGSDVEGVFRIPGQKTEIDSHVENASDVQERFAKEKNINNIAGAMKQIISHLNPRLIPEELNTQCLQVVESEEKEAIQILRSAVEKMPKENYQLLRTIILYLHDLGNKPNTDKTKMDHHNLALVWGPNFFNFSEQDPHKGYDMMTKFNNVTEQLIKHANKIFKHPQNRLFNIISSMV